MLKQKLKKKNNLKVSITYLCIIWCEIEKYLLLIHWGSKEKYLILETMIIIMFYKEKIIQKINKNKSFINWWR